MDWKQGYTSTLRLYSVNQSTWGDGDEIDGLVSASITKDSESALVEDASISLDGEPIKGYVRLVLEAANNASTTRVDIATVLVTAPKRSINGTLFTYDLECYSVLKPASDKVLPSGWYFPEGGDPVFGAFDLLSKSLQCPIDPVESDIRTEYPIVAESNETALSMANYLLQGTNHFIDIDGRGRVQIKEKSSVIKATFDTFENDILMPDITDETDIFNIPNILRVSDSLGNRETIYNNDEYSDTSIENIGWEKWQDEQVTLSNGETLIGKGNAMMEALSKSVRKIGYTREFDPEIRVNDLALYMLPKQKIIGTFRIISQSLNIGSGIQVKEVATFETSNWKG